MLLVGVNVGYEELGLALEGILDVGLAVVGRDEEGVDEGLLEVGAPEVGYEDEDFDEDSRLELGAPVGEREGFGVGLLMSVRSINV
jgi:hypothetical protein